MFQTDASYYLPYYDAYPNPPLTNSGSDITSSKYGLGASAIPTNTYWGIYAGKLGLGQAIFEASQWMGAYADSVLATYPWFIRGGRAGDTTYAGVESLTFPSGYAYSYYGVRCIVRVGS